MNSIIVALIGTIPSLLAVIGTYLATKKATKEGVVLSIKADIMMIYDRARSQGYITKFQYELFDELAAKYYNLGGNGFIHKVHEEVKQMDLK